MWEDTVDLIERPEDIPVGEDMTPEEARMEAFLWDEDSAEGFDPF